MDQLIKRNSIVNAKMNGQKVDSLVGVMAVRRTSGQWRRRSSIIAVKGIYTTFT
jgi:hypothetical protein